MLDLYEHMSYFINRVKRLWPINMALIIITKLYLYKRQSLVRDYHYKHSLSTCEDEQCQICSAFEIDA